MIALTIKPHLEVGLIIRVLKIDETPLLKQPVHSSSWVGFGVNFQLYFLEVGCMV